MSVQTKVAADKMIFRGTDKHRGRQVVVTPKNSSMEHLAYARIILDGETTSARFETGAWETGLVCIAGTGIVTSDGETHRLTRYDAIYIPRGRQVEVATDSFADFAECSAEVEGTYPLQIVRYAEVEKNDSLRFTTGSDTNKRTINILIGKNVQAGRILVGVTRSEPGNWTSWPPHEHAQMLEELYIYYDMPAPAFGVQFVYTDTDEPELVTVVRDGDCVLMPAGYHPNVAIPGHPINFVWMMAAHREVEDRQYGVVNVQPEFNQNGSGLEASRK